MFCSAQPKPKRRGGPGGLNKLCGVSPELQVIVGQPAMPRTEVCANTFDLFFFTLHIPISFLLPEIFIICGMNGLDCEATVGVHKEKQSPRS
jgi:hypothetical protein